MNYKNGKVIEPGDIVQIDEKYSGRVVASMDNSKYLAGYEHWSYLAAGIMVDTGFGGMVHYTAEATDTLVFSRKESEVEN